MPKKRSTISKTKQEQDEYLYSAPTVQKKKKKQKRSNTTTNTPASLDKQGKEEKKKNSVNISESSVNEQSTIDESNIAKQNLLVSILSEDLEHLEQLITEVKKHTNTLNYRDGKDHTTLLHRCVIQQNSDEVFQLLLKHNADINAPDLHGKTPLHMVSYNDDIPRIRLFMEAGANPMAKTLLNQTPLHIAASAGKLGAIKILIGAKVLVNLHDSAGYTPLHLATKHEFVHCVKYLLDHGASPLSLTNEGFRPLDILEVVSISKKTEKLKYTPQGKQIYQLLKKHGGKRLPALVATESILIGEGYVRKSLGHKDISRRRSVKFVRTSTFNHLNLDAAKAKAKAENDLESSRTPVLKFERNVELQHIEEENLSVSLQEFTLSNPSKEEKKKEEPLIKLDKFGFIKDEKEATGLNSPEMETNGTTKVTQRTNSKVAIQENQKAMKWVEIMKGKSIKTKQMIKLCDAGIPDQVRGQVWCYLAGIEVDQNNSIYYTLLRKKPWVQSIYDQIHRDIDRTMPRHILFRSKGQGQTMLTNVLLAYSALRPDVGYCQGMGFITAMFLMYMTEENAFWLLDKVAFAYSFGDIWEEQMRFLKQCMHCFSNLLEAKQPEVIAVYEENGLPIQAFSSQFFITGYMYNLPFDMAARVWDSFWMRGFDYWHAVGLSIIKLSKTHILQLDMEELMSFFQFKEAKGIPFTSNQLVDSAASTFSKLKSSDIRKWENEFKESMRKEKEQLELRRAKLRTLEEDKKEREAELQLEMNEEEEDEKIQSDVGVEGGKKQGTKMEEKKTSENPNISNHDSEASMIASTTFGTDSCAPTETNDFAYSEMTEEATEDN